MAAADLLEKILNPTVMLGNQKRNTMTISYEGLLGCCRDVISALAYLGSKEFYTRLFGFSPEFETEVGFRQRQDCLKKIVDISKRLRIYTERRFQKEDITE